MAEVAQAWISLVPSARGFGKATANAIDGDMQNVGKSSGGKFSGAFTKVAKVGALGGVAAIGAAFVKGFGRLTALENAEAKLKGLGYSGKAVASVMGDVNTAVKGTAFGLDEAGSAAAGALASGIKPGKELTGFLRLTGDAATQAGVDFNSMAQMMNKVQGQGKLTGDVVNQMAENGLYIIPMLAKSYGVSQEAMTKMVSAGKIDSAAFKKVLTENIGGSALKSGDTTTGALKNMGAAFGRFSAALLSGVFPKIKAGFGSITTGLDDMKPAAAAFGAILGTALVFAFTALSKVLGVIATVAGFISEHTTTFKIIAGVITALLVPAFILWGVQATIAAAKSVAAWVASGIAAVVNSAFHLVGLGLIGAGWVIAGVQAMAGAARIAAAWVLSKLGVAGTIALYGIAYGIIIAGWIASGVAAMAGAAAVAAAWLISIWPIALVVAAIAGVVFLIVKHWDTIKAKTVAVWSAITGAVSRAVSAVVGFVKAHWPLLLAIIAGPIGLAVLLVVKHWARIKAATSAAFNFVRSTVSSAVNAARSTVSSAVGGIVSIFRGLLGRIKGALSGAGGALVGVGMNIVNGLISGIRRMGGAIGRALVALLPGPLKKFAGALGIASPSKVFRDFGLNIGEGLVIGVDGSRASVEDSMSRLVSSVTMPAGAKFDTSTAIRGQAAGAPSGDPIDYTRLAEEFAKITIRNNLSIGKRDAATLVTVGTAAVGALR